MACIHSPLRQLQSPPTRALTAHGILDRHPNKRTCASHTDHESHTTQVILDKNLYLRTIVNKVGSIETEYRVFPMEVIAGDACLETEVQQHGARFRLDFSQVSVWRGRAMRAMRRGCTVHGVS